MSLDLKNKSFKITARYNTFTKTNMKMNQSGHYKNLYMPVLLPQKLRPNTLLNTKVADWYFHRLFCAKIWNFNLKIF